ncbi:MAG: Clp protease N-terminal domain-containing protein [Gemmatimonadota bacterium]
MNTGYNFTERVRKVLAISREEAHRLGHEYVGTEHLLLGLIKEGEGVAAATLQNLNADLDALKDKIIETITQGMASQATGPDLPYTSRAKKVLELSMAEARDLNHSYVGTEHLLLGLLREEKGIAAQTLVHYGVTLEPTRTEILRLLGGPAEASSDAPATPQMPPTRRMPETPRAEGIVGVNIQLLMANGSTAHGSFPNVASALSFLKQTAHGAARDAEL